MSSASFTAHDEIARAALAGELAFFNCLGKNFDDNVIDGVPGNGDPYTLPAASKDLLQVLDSTATLIPAYRDAVALHFRLRNGVHPPSLYIAANLDSGAATESLKNRIIALFKYADSTGESKTDARKEQLHLVYTTDEHTMMVKSTASG
ncbi:hypothetical protein HDV00_002011 [Rhizophlyctis rosea]|nr:hypothetical protein HDV00_002011 [Rhizophlyctis rosea]